MSNRIFIISGSFEQNGEWLEPNPSFKGKIVVEEDGFFRGYCNELYSSDTPEINRVRYIAGHYPPIDKDAIEFYKFSNYPYQDPLYYQDGWMNEPQSGDWLVYNFLTGKFMPAGKAHVSVVPVVYSPEEESEILDKYNELDLDNDFNREILNAFLAQMDRLPVEKPKKEPPKRESDSHYVDYGFVDDDDLPFEEAS